MPRDSCTSVVGVQKVGVDALEGGCHADDAFHQLRVLAVDVDSF